jgi:epsin
MDFLKGALARARLPPVEQKVFDATNTDPWGPHGAVLGEIARLTAAPDDRAQVLGVLWRRLAEEKPEQWRVVYKALTVLEYLVANGSEACVNELRASMSRVSALSSFHYKDPEGKDQARRHARSE